MEQLKQKCGKCRKIKRLFTITLCKQCTFKQRKERKELENKRIQEGICICCGKNEINKMRSNHNCTICLDKKKEWSKNNYNAQKKV